MQIEVEKLMIVLEGFLRENLRDFSRYGHAVGDEQNSVIIDTTDQN